MKVGGLRVQKRRVSRSGGEAINFLEAQSVPPLTSRAHATQRARGVHVDQIFCIYIIRLY